VQPVAVAVEPVALVALVQPDAKIQKFWTVIRISMEKLLQPALVVPDAGKCEFQMGSTLVAVASAWFHRHPESWVEPGSAGSGSDQPGAWPEPQWP